jgi:hypothetical protein
MQGFDRNKPANLTGVASKEVRDNFGALASNHSGNTPPDDAEEGWLWYDSSVPGNETLKLFGASGWRILSSGAETDYTFNVLSYGATADASVDSTEAFQSALDYAGVSGGSVFVPRGTYQISGRLLYKSTHPICIFGDGFSSKVLWSAPPPVYAVVTGATNLSPIEVSAAYHPYATGDFVFISGVTGNTAANGSWVVTKTGTNTFTLNGSTGNGAYAGSGTAYAIKQFAFLGVAGTGFGSSYHCRGVKIHDLYVDFGFSRAGGWAEHYRGINIFASDHIDVSGCWFEGSKGECLGLGNFGTVADAGEYAYITDNFFYDFAQDGINPNVYRTRISGNTFMQGTQGVEAGRSKIIVTDNDFEDMTSYGVGLCSVSEFVVSKNRFKDCCDTNLGYLIGSVELLESGGGTPCTDGVISANEIVNTNKHVWQTGICAVPGALALPNVHSRVNIVGNNIYGTQNGIYLSWLKNSFITSNYIVSEGTAATAIDIANVVGTEYVTVTNNNASGTFTTAAFWDETTGQHNKMDSNYEDAVETKEARVAIVEGFYQDNVTASQTAVQLLRHSKNEASIRPIRNGSIVGVSVFSNAVCTAGTLTINIYVAGSPIGISIALDPVTHTTTNSAVYPAGTYLFTSGQAITAHVTTNSGWLPTTADIDVSVEISELVEI